MDSTAAAVPVLEDLSVTLYSPDADLNPLLVYASTECMAPSLTSLVRCVCLVSDRMWWHHWLGIPLPQNGAISQTLPITRCAGAELLHPQHH